MTEEYITVGEIVNTQGIKGEVRVLPTTDFPERFQQTKQIYALQQGKRQLLNIERVWEHKQFIIVKFQEVADMTAAEKLKGSLLQVTRSQLTELPKESFYVFDIVGLKVIDDQGQELGVVADVLCTGANDVYVVKRDEGKDILIPALKSVVKKIDIPTGIMEVALPEGLI